jgi:NAD(P)-dependent dehydrogenase (short-subunit alcohol dehydrogenase family)
MKEEMDMKKKHLEGETIIVTGAANGMGTVHARMFAEQGANIVANDISPKVQETVDAIVAAGGQAIASLQDVTDPAQAEAIVRTAIDCFGRLDGIVHNAAVNLASAFSEITHENFDKTMKVNAYGIFNLSKAAWPHFLAQKHGRLIYIGAASTLSGVGGMASYNASKGVPIGLSNSLAIEGADHGITSNVIFPAAITDMSSASMDDETKRQLSPKLRAEWVTPVLTWLMRRENTVSGKIIMASTSRASEIFVAWADGFESPDINVDEIIANEATVLDRSKYTEMFGLEEFMTWVLR